MRMKITAWDYNGQRNRYEPSSILIIFHFFPLSLSLPLSLCLFDVCLLYLFVAVCIYLPADRCCYGSYYSNRLLFCFLLLHLKMSVENFSWLQFFFLSINEICTLYNAHWLAAVDCILSSHCCKCISFLCSSYISMAKRDAYRRHYQQPWIALHSSTFFSLLLSNASAKPHLLSSVSFTRHNQEKCIDSLSRLFSHLSMLYLSSIYAAFFWKRYHIENTEHFVWFFLNIHFACILIANLEFDYTILKFRNWKIGQTIFRKLFKKQFSKFANTTITYVSIAYWANVFKWAKKKQSNAI